MENALVHALERIPSLEASGGFIKEFSKTFPEISEEFMRVRQQIVDNFYDMYVDYCTNYGNFSSVADPNSVAFLMFVASKYPGHSIVECGSGFSTFGLRLVSDKVITVEDDGSWHGLTLEYLKATGLSERGSLIHDKESPIKYTPEEKYWSFVDGVPRTRRKYFKQLVAAEAPFIVLDDLQFLHYRNPYVKTLKASSFPYDLYSLHRETSGSGWRYMGIAIRKGFEFK